MEQWQSARRRGDFDVRKSDAFLLELWTLIKSYVEAKTNFNESKAKSVYERIKSEYKSVYDMFMEDNTGYQDTREAKGFISHMFEKVHGPLQTELKERTRALINKRQDWTAREYALQKMVCLPTVYFNPVYTALLDPRVCEKSTQVQTPAVKVTPRKMPRKEEETEKRVVKKPKPPAEEPAKVIRGEFQKLESLRGNWAESDFLLWQPPNSQPGSSQEMVFYDILTNTKKRFTYSGDNSPVAVSDEEVTLLKQAAQFWVGNLFNTVLAPCNFAAPKSLHLLKEFAKYREQIFVPLVKFAVTKKKDIPIMTRSQWEDYFRIIFPTVAAPWFEKGDLSELYPAEAAKGVKWYLNYIEKNFILS